MHTDTSTAARIDNRYELLSLLSAGGMGSVYRAYDHLTQQAVALKQITIGELHLLFETVRTRDELRVALALEFSTLASLRHPHIISVLDYGFDAQRQPYFTMELLEDARTIIEAGRNRPLPYKLGLLTQVFQALAYLHRRGVVHRDLKPDNILVVGDIVRVLDFGLALAHDRHSENDLQPVGTVAYMAPEVLSGERASEAADLYAVGLIAYELLAERYPFDVHNVRLLIRQIVTEFPDVWSLSVEPPVITVVARLLAKAPDDRYATAHEALIAWSEALGMPVSAETPAIRESYLQSAMFVGRDAELSQLRDGLSSAFLGHGNAWLVGGESGVGKSRLLDELRIHALVEGALVLHGQGAESGLNYQWWREPVRRLALSTPLSDLEAAILTDVLPDVGRIVAREIAPAPDMEAALRVNRLAYVLVGLFRRQPRPVLLLMEDLQWSSESTDLLKLVVREVNDLPLMIVGTYRDDERPELAEELRTVRLLRLERLSPRAIAALSEAMLGTSNPALVALLERETEGNALFLVEVVRALAEEAGNLHYVGTMQLPEKVASGGIEQVIRRRLARVPPDAVPLLQLAAVAGRHLDLDVLRAAAPDVSIDDWLIACGDAAVLEVRDGGWRFRHDKLRDGVLAGLTTNERRPLHRAVAETLERLRPDDLTLSAVLLDHWTAEGSRDKEFHYAVMACEQAERISSFSDMVRLGWRALNLLGNTGTDAERMRLYNQIAFAYLQSGDALRTTEAAGKSLDLARKLGDIKGTASALHILGSALLNRADYTEARGYLEESLTLWQHLEDERGMGHALIGLVFLESNQGNMPLARAYVEQGIAMGYECGDKRLLAQLLQRASMIAGMQGDYATGTRYAAESVALCEEIGDRWSAAPALFGFAWNAEQQKDWLTAEAYYNQTLALTREIESVWIELACLRGLGNVASARGEWALAQRYYEDSQRLSELEGNKRSIVDNLIHLARVALETRRPEQALATLRESLAIAKEIADVPMMMEALSALAHYYLTTGHYERSAALVGLLLDSSPTIPGYVRDSLPDLQHQLAPMLPPSAMSRASKRFETTDLQAVIAAVFGWK